MSANWLTKSKVCGAILIVLGVVTSGVAVSMSRSQGESNSPVAAGAEKEPADLGYRIIPHDIGVVIPESATESVIRIVNETDRTCSIRGVWSDCGCIVNELTSPMAAPGDDWKLKFRYKAPKSTGRISQRIILRFKEAGVEPIMVQIHGAVREWAEASPNEISFGDLCGGLVVVKLLQVITWGDEQRLAPNPEVTGIPSVQIRFLSSDTVVNDKGQTSGSVHRFRLTFAPSPQTVSGDHRGEIRFAAAHGKEQLRVPCHGRVLSKISVFPDQAFLGIIQENESKKCTIRLRFNDPTLRSKANETVVTVDSPDFKASVTDTDDPAELLLTVETTRTTNHKAGIRTSVVTVNAGKRSLVVPVQAWFE